MKKINKKKLEYFGLGSVISRSWSADPDPDPDKNETAPQHYFKYRYFILPGDNQGIESDWTLWPASVEIVHQQLKLTSSRAPANNS